MQRAVFIMFMLIGCSIDKSAIGSEHALDNNYVDAQSGAGQVEVPIETSTGGSYSVISPAGIGGSAGATPENTPLAGTGGLFWPVAGQAGSVGGTEDGNADSGYDAGISDSDAGMPDCDGAVSDSGAPEPEVDATIAPECVLPDDEPGDCHTWECDGDTAIKVIDDSDEPEWNRDHPLWDTLSTTMPTCSYYGCDNGVLGMQMRPECYIDREVTWGWGVCFYCFNGNTAYLFDCQDPNASSAWDAVCP